MPKSSEKLRKLSEELGNFQEFPKTSETLQIRFWEAQAIYKNFGKPLAIFEKYWENFENGPKVENLRECWEIFGNYDNGSKLFFRWFYDFLTIFGKSWESSKVFRNLGIFSETVQRCFSDVFTIFWNFRKIFGSVRKSSENFLDKLGNVHNGSQELKSFGSGFEKSLKGPQ